MKKSFFARWRANFFTGLAITLPAIISLAAVKWLFGTVSSFTDALLFFLPHVLSPKKVYENGLSGQMFWYWSLLALVLAVGLISTVGVLARYYIGKQLIEWLDSLMMQVPLLNKFYGAIKQVNEAFAGNKNSFKTVVLVEFPRAGMYSVGFLTSEQRAEVQQKTREKVVAVFIPTTPNPTSGFIVILPRTEVIELAMNVDAAMKMIVTLGVVSPPALQHA